MPAVAAVQCVEACLLVTTAAGAHAMPARPQQRPFAQQKKSTCTQEPAPQARACIGLQNDDWAPAMIQGGKPCAPPAHPVELDIGRVKRSENFPMLGVTYNLQQRNTHVIFANTGLHSCVVPVGHSKAYHGDSGVKSIARESAAPIPMASSLASFSETGSDISQLEAPDKNKCAVVTCAALGMR